jgi:hypothetical protein
MTVRRPAPPVRIDGELRILTPYERRVVLGVQTLLRWKRLSVYWPPEATCATEADPAWQQDVLHHYLAVVLGPLDLPTPLLHVGRKAA